MELSNARTGEQPYAPPAGRINRMARVAIAVSAVVAGAALLLAQAAAAQPLPKTNTYPDLYYPFFLAPFGVLLTVIGTLVAARRRANPRGTQVSVGGVGWTVNALLVAARGLAATPEGAWLPRTAVAWTEDWFYLFNDFGTILFLVLLYPTGTATGAWRWIARGLAAVVCLMALAGMFAAGPLDSTGGIQNPLGIPGTHWAYWAVGNVGYPLVLIGGGLVLVARAVTTAVWGSRARRPLAGYLAAMIALILAAHIWMFSSASDSDPKAWIGWLGFVPALAAMVVVGAIGIGRLRAAE